MLLALALGKCPSLLTFLFAPVGAWAPAVELLTRHPKALHKKEHAEPPHALHSIGRPVLNESTLPFEADMTCIKQQTHH